jgi:gamma-polyglutamate biosynthesis protein CapA
MSKKIENTINKLSVDEHAIVKLIACGDIGIYSHLEKNLLERGPRAVLGNAIELFKNYDIVFGNLEGTVSDCGMKANYPPPYPNLRMNPKTIDLLKEGGFNILNLANNHMLDYKADALLDTINRLDKANINHFGAGCTRDKAKKPKIMVVNGVRIGFVGFHEDGAIARDTSPGSCQLTNKLARESICKLRSLADIIVVSVHSGYEYFDYPSPYHVSLYRGLIDQGAHIILGHHPHVPQGVEKYKEGIIAYSLGNFAFYLGEPESPKSKQGFLLEIEMTKKRNFSYKIIPFELTKELSINILEGRKREEKEKEYNKLSNNLINGKDIKYEWYMFLRKYYLGYLVYYWKYDFKRGNMIQFIRRLIMLFKPTTPNLIKLRSIFGFVLSGYFIKAELKKMLN